MAQQGSPPRRSGRLSARGRRSDEEYRYARRDRFRSDGKPQQGPYYSDPYDDEEDPPPWAGASIYPAGPGGKERRPPRPDETGPHTDPGRTMGRAAATRARRSKRRAYAIGGMAVALILVALGATGNLPFIGSSSAHSHSDLVTTFQPGDVRSVPSACDAVSTATLGQYLPGKRTMAVTQSLKMQSQCTWTLDARPVYRVLEITTQAFAPNLLSTGNGSATFGAIDAYDNALQQMKNPPKSTHRPKAQLGAPRGLGDAAFSALQVWRIAGNKTDFVTVVTRDRNVLITVTLQGLDSIGPSHRYGPVPVPSLQAGALAAAKQALAAVT